MITLRFLIIMFLLPATLLCAETSGVHFHQKTRTFTLEVREQSLSSVLAEIAEHADLKINLSPAADQQISLQLHEASPEETVKSIVKTFRLNTLYSYVKADNRNQLNSVTILPQGVGQHTAITTPDTQTTTPRRPEESTRRLSLSERRQQDIEEEKKRAMEWQKMRSNEQNSFLKALGPQPVPQPEEPSGPTTSEHKGLFRFQMKKPPEQ